MPRPCRPTLALITALALIPCAARPALTSHAAPTDGMQDMLVLRSGTGSQAAFLTQTTGGMPSVSLPLGILDRTGRILYAAQADPSGSSLIRAIDVASGRTLRQVRIVGSFSSRSGDYAVGSVPPPGVNGFTSPSAHAPLVATPATAAPSAHVAIPERAGYPADGSQVLTALSFNGRWLALRATDSDQANTRIVVIDTGAMRTVADRWIGGAFGLDAISADGRLVYLIQSLPTRGYGVYQVRSYQVGHTGVDARVVAPSEVPGSMSGEAWSRAWSPDGSWLYTLYVQSSGYVFVHALHLAARETRCIDFPTLSGSVQETSHFTQSVAPDGGTLYAINPVLGLAVAVRSLPGGKVSVAHLAARAGSPQRTQSAAVAADGRTVFVATGAGVWAIDATALTLRRVFVPYQEVASVALSGDGLRLYALSLTDQAVDVLTPATGAFTNSLQIQGGWAIETVMAAS